MAGWVLGQAGLKTKSRKGLAALILGANMPDIDVFFGSAPWQPLATHRGFTHGLVGGVLLMPPILFGLLWLLDRWQQGNDRQFKSGLPMRPAWLLGLCYLGALTHPFLDLLTTYSVQLFSPLSTRWYHADGLFIIDLFLWILLGVSLFWSKRQEKRGRADWPRAAQNAIGIAVAYVALNLLISDRAEAAIRSRSASAEAVFTSPPPVLFWRRDLTWREGHCYRWSHWDPVSGIGPVSRCTPDGMSDPAVREALRREPSLRKFLRWSVMPLASSEASRCGIKVTIGDARYMQLRGRSGLMREAVVPTNEPGCPPTG